MKNRVLIPLALGHLGMVVLGACRANLVHSPVLGKYAALSGADSSYGFFAPGVGSQLRANFSVIDGSGKERQTALDEGGSHEVALRTASIVGLFWDEVKQESVRRAIAASWAGKLFSRNASAKEVVIRLDSYDLPSMKDYRRGVRPQWVPFYRAKFVYQNH